MKLPGLRRRGTRPARGVILAGLLVAIPACPIPAVAGSVEVSFTNNTGLTVNKDPRPEAEVLGWPPRGGRFRPVAPFGGGDVGKAPSGP
jgi:hypothetical protein